MNDGLIHTKAGLRRTGLALAVAAALGAAAISGCGSNTSSIESSAKKQIEAGTKQAEEGLQKGTKEAEKAIEEAKSEVKGGEGNKQFKEGLEQAEEGVKQGKAQAEKEIEEAKKQIEEATE
jgi:hypothetical protein